MQKLHLVGFTASFDGLIFSARKGAKSGSYVVPLDGRLLKQIAEAERQRDGGPARDDAGQRSGSPRLVRPESSLTPREMQDRIRSGWSVDEVAAEAGVDFDWVSRFAAPVLAEVRQVIERGRAAVFDKPRVGLSSLPLGASVRRNILERGVQLTEEDLDECWSAYQLEDDVWVLHFEYLSRGRTQEAEWVLDLEDEQLTSRNRLGSQLGHVVKGRARRPAATAAAPMPKPSPQVVRAAKAARRVAPPVVRPPVAPTRTSTKPATRPSTKATKVTKATKTTKTTKGRTAAAPRKKAGSRPAKKPAKETAPALPAASRLIRPMPMPALKPVQPVVRSVREEDWAPEVPRRRIVAPPQPEPVREDRREEAGEAVSPITGEAPVVTFDAPPAPMVVRAAPTPIVPEQDDVEPPLPGAVEFDEETRIARIDSRRMSHYVSAPPPRATFRGDVSRAEGAASDGPARRPRRTEPLRSR